MTPNRRIGGRLASRLAAAGLILAAAGYPRVIAEGHHLFRGHYQVGLTRSVSDTSAFTTTTCHNTSHEVEVEILGIEAKTLRAGRAPTFAKS